MESLVWRPAAPLFTRLVPKVGGLSASLRGLGCRLYLVVTYFFPSLVRPVSGSPPLAGSALVGPPLALPSRGAGGPLSLFVPPVSAVFGVSVLSPS